MHFKGCKHINLIFDSITNVSKFVLIALLITACDDQSNRTTTVDQTVDQTLETDAQSENDQTPNQLDMMVNDSGIQAIITECDLRQSVQSTSQRFEGALANPEYSLLSWSWPEDSLDYLALMDDTVATSKPSEEQWPEIEFSCENLAYPEGMRQAISPTFGIIPRIQNENSYWAWRRKARLSIALQIQIDEAAIPYDELELWWWPYRDSSNSDTPGTNTFAESAKRLMLRNPSWDAESQSLSFDVDEWGAYALMLREKTSGELNPPPLKYRAIMGVSMGGGGSAQIGTRHPELFDFVAPLGGPSDWLYMLHYVTDRLLSGFCDGNLLGEFCGNGPSQNDFEQYSDFLNWIYTENGAQFDRDMYIKVFQDVVFAFGNPTTYHPNGSYLPPGIPIEELLKSRRERCRRECRDEECEASEDWLKLSQFYDHQFNPEGTYPVIPVCDGHVGDGPPAQWTDLDHRKPIDLFLAVDLNNNGRRDQNEPIIVNTSEPFEDIGCDGLADRNEAGYHPLFNPDPSGDNFHWLNNPFGTEGDRLFQGANGDVGLDFTEWPEQVLNPEYNQVSRIKSVLERNACSADELGEPFNDYGLDGVPLTMDLSDGGFDWGESNGRFDYNPHKINFMATNPAFWLAETLSQDEGTIPRFWIDGGIRDVMNFAVASMHLAGRLHALSPAPLTLFDSFSSLLGADLYLPGRAPVNPLHKVGQHVLFRYGNPDASPEEIEQGDGGHVGTNAQAAGRVSGALDWMASFWKENLSDQAAGTSGSRVLSDSVDSERFGGRYHFEVVTPPGYYDENNQDRQYPVVYFLHGYGQKPSYATSSNVLFSGAMSSGIWPPMIFVYPDGSCSDMKVRACNDGVDNDGDELIDLDDPGCQDNEQRRVEDDEPNESSPPRCQDRVDNDLDGLVDLDDPGCLSPDHDDEGECREGTFYLNHLVNIDGIRRGRDYESAFLDMIHYIDQNYRTLSRND